MSATLVGSHVQYGTHYNWGVGPQLRRVPGGRAGRGCGGCRCGRRRSAGAGHHRARTAHGAAQQPAGAVRHASLPPTYITTTFFKETTRLPIYIQCDANTHRTHTKNTQTRNNDMVITQCCPMWDLNPQHLS